MSKAEVIKKGTVAALAIAAAIGAYEGTDMPEPVNTVGVNEIVSERTEYTKTFQGEHPWEFRMVSSVDPIHYQDDGEWKTIDKSVREKPVILKALSEYDYVVNAGPYMVELKGEKPYNYKFTGNGATVEFTALFDTTDAVEIIEETNARGVKETVILQKGAPLQIQWQVNIEGEAKENERGWTVYNKDGEPAFDIPPLTATDANGKAVTVTALLTEATLSAVVDDKGTEYPITVDPTVLISSPVTYGVITNTQAVWQTARDGTSGTSLGASGLGMGTASPSSYQVRRTAMLLQLGIDAATVDACSLSFTASSSFGSQNYYLYSGLSTISTSIDVNDFNKFDGWTSGSAHTGAVLASQSFGAGLTGTKYIPFNSTGLDSVRIRGNGNIWLMGLGEQDKNNSYLEANIAGSDVQLIVHYTSYTCNQTYTASFPADSIYTHRTIGTSYANARGVAAYTGVFSTSIDTLGQRQLSGTDYRNYRISLRFPSLRQWNQVTGARIILNGVQNATTTDFDYKMYDHTWTHGANIGTFFYSFDGWQAISTVYNGTNLLETKSTGTFSAGPDTLSLNAAGLAKLLAASADTARFVLISGNDVLSTNSGNDEYVVFNSAGARLEVTFALNDSIPADLKVTSISPDSLKITFRDRTFDETGFLVENANTGARVDSVGPNVTEIHIGGLSVNTLYAYRIKVCGGVYADSVSAPDSCYTRANVPSTPTRTVVSDSTINIKVNANGNPDYTEFAIVAVDSIGDTTHVDFRRWPRVLRDGAPGRDSTNHWAVRDSIGGDSGIEVQVGVGKWYRWMTKARNGR